MDIIKIFKTDVRNLSKIEHYNFDDRYVCNRKGEIFRVKEINPNFFMAVKMSPFITKLGYVEYVLTDKDGNKKHVLTQRVVAYLFLPKPKSKLHIEVNHRDGNKENNYYKNLHWVTKSYNITHMHGMYKDKSRK